MRKSVVIVASSMVILLVMAIVLVWLIKAYCPYMGKDFVIPSPTRTPVVPVEISSEDKIQILTEVISQFPDMEPKNKRKEKTRSKFYILKGSVPFPSFEAAQLPSDPGMTVELITESEIDAQKQDREVEYYEFRDFRAGAGTIILPVIWNKRGRGSSHSTGFEFTANRIEGKWNVVREVTGVSVAH